MLISWLTLTASCKMWDEHANAHTLDSNQFPKTDDEVDSRKHFMTVPVTIHEFCVLTAFFLTTARQDEVKMRNLQISIHGMGKRVFVAQGRGTGAMTCQKDMNSITWYTWKQPNIEQKITAFLLSLCICTFHHMHFINWYTVRRSRYLYKLISFPACHVVICTAVNGEQFISHFTWCL